MTNEYAALWHRPSTNELLADVAAGNVRWRTRANAAYAINRRTWQLCTPQIRALQHHGLVDANPAADGDTFELTDDGVRVLLHDWSGQKIVEETR